MRRLIGSVIACSIMLIPITLFAKNEATTGICFRRITALDKRGTVIDRYESVIVRPSSSLANDIARVARVSGKGGPLMSPDLIANTWVGASISDTAYDETISEDCSKLPQIPGGYR